MDSNLNIAYVNPAWDNFARDNDGSQLTVKAVICTNIFQVIPSVLSPFYARVFDEVLQPILEGPVILVTPYCAPSDGASC